MYNCVLDVDNTQLRVFFECHDGHSPCYLISGNIFKCMSMSKCTTHVDHEQCMCTIHLYVNHKHNTRHLCSHYANSYSLSHRLVLIVCSFESGMGTIIAWCAFIHMQNTYVQSWLISGCLYKQLSNADSAVSHYYIPVCIIWDVCAML